MTSQGNKIAIVGGGVSGLAVAFQLITQVDRERALDITVFESKGSLGGNADTVEVVLGVDQSEKKTGDYKRWADLGVNDFSETNYEMMLAVMKRIGFKDYKPLEDTASFFTPDGSVLFTLDDFYKGSETRRIVDERFSLAKQRKELDTVNENFMEKAAADVKKSRDKYRLMTVADYVQEYRSAQDEKTRALVDEMAEHILYPRIAAMYFVSERGPRAMPIVAVMEYYILQEGYGSGTGKKKPERRYFDRGSAHWIEALAKWLEEPQSRCREEDRRLPKVRICYNYQAKVTAGEEDITLYSAGERGSEGMSAPERFDKVVFSCHADDALRSFGPEGLTEGIATMLGKVSYTNSIAVCHTFTGVLPPHRDTWRTYNVLIREGAAMTPYSMTYVINRHQNDGDNPDYQEAGLPQYFVTLNPAVRIPEAFVLPTVESAKERVDKSPGYGFPQAVPATSGRAAGLFGEGDHTDPGKATCWFKHNVLDFDCLDAQEMLPELQGGQFGNVFFAGGWTLGAGLHEQCWQQAEKVFREMFPDSKG